MTIMILQELEDAHKARIARAKEFSHNTVDMGKLSKDFFFLMMLCSFVDV